MQYIKGVESYNETQYSAVTLGKFDGLHRGHQKLVNKVRGYASSNVKSIIFAFDMNKYFEDRGISKENIMSNEERRIHLEDKVDYLIECPFTEEIHSMEAEIFIRKILVEKLHAKYIVVGTDFHFGYGKKGNVQLLQKCSEQYGYHLDIIEKEVYKGRVISSSYVKEELRKGNIEIVNELLGYPYCVWGQVEHGKKLGRTLGFPTMNVVPYKGKLLPPNGVYATKSLVNGITYEGIGNVGVKPTVTDVEKLLVEVYLFEYSGDAYGEIIQIQFYTFERPEIKFSSIQELKEHVNQDIIFGKYFFEKTDS